MRTEPPWRSRPGLQSRGGALTDGAPHDLVVIGASAGGVETLRRVMAGLPADLRATVCVVLHIAPTSPSALASILGRSGPLPCHAAVDGEALRHGEILVAPPDRHLVIDDAHVRLTVGPRENGHRPAVDVLFRTAAGARGGRVIGVVLSGNRDDGSAGLAVIKARGGMAVVQDPSDAMYAGMPTNALAHVVADAVVPSDRLAEVVVAMVAGGYVEREEALDDGDPPDTLANGAGDDRRRELLVTVCPECGGVLSERSEEGVTQWECRVGHRYSPDSLLRAQASGVEATLWAAMRALVDRRMLLDRMADRFERYGNTEMATQMRRQAADAARQAVVVRDVLAQATVSSLAETDA